MDRSDAQMKVTRKCLSKCDELQEEGASCEGLGQEPLI